MNEYLRAFEGDLFYNCAIFALMSINSSLAVNIKKFERYQTTGAFTGLFPDKYKALTNCDKSQDCILDILNGLKVRNFCMNLYNPLDPDYVTIDRHAARIAGYDKGLTRKKYVEIATAYKNVSKEIYLLPNQLQACTWSIKVGE